MSEPCQTENLSGWGRIAPAECAAYRPETVRSVGAILESTAQPHYIARGLGRSYGDTAVNGGGGVIGMARLDRMLNFDDTTGVLECEAGVSLEDIIEVFLPRGYFLPVTPGTKFVTVGGAIANDIHGKNHHRDGTFCRFVDSLELLTPQGEVLRCAPTENAEVFWATAGGIGLTGVILTAKVRLQRVASAYMSVDYVKAPNLETALESLAAHDADYQYSVAWVDCLARGKSLGRSVIMYGNHATPEQLNGGQRSDPFQIPRARAKSVPFDCPQFVLNPWSIRAFNTILNASYRNARGMICDYDRYFYPLDKIHHWNRLYGKKGFVQYQATLPSESKKGLVHLLQRLSDSRRASFLAVLKCFGEQGEGLLSHPMKGYTLTLDIPNHRGLHPFLKELDAILLDYGGRLYLAKDAVAEPETFARMYPKLDAFREIKAKLDPRGRLSSSMARRLGIVS